MSNIVIVNGVDVFAELEKKDKLLKLYKEAYDKSNAEVLKMFKKEQDEKTTLSNIIGHLDDSETVVQLRKLGKWKMEKDLTEISKPKFQVGEVVIYQNGDRFELGIVKTVERHEYYNDTNYKYRVWYHTGETTAMTDEHLLKKISNLYAFKIKRYDTEGKVIDE